MSQQVVEELLSGDREIALSKVFSHNRAALRRLVVARMDPNLRCRVDPSDIVQETLIDACRRLDSYLANPGMPFLKWLYFLAEQNTLIAYRKHVAAQKRSIRREHQYEQSDEHSRRCLISDQTDPIQKLANVERMMRLQHAISMLSTPSQTVIRMRFLEGRSLADIADELGISVSAVAKRAVRSLSKLTKFADELGLGTWN